MKKFSVLVFVIAVACSAESNEVFVNDKGVAASGYDVVAYFNESKPVAGNENFRYEWKNALWYFSSEQNLNAFKANPSAYAPQYGGYCAYGTADGDGHKASTEPDAWKIVDNKLYLNYNKNVQGLWLKDQTNFIRKADENWPEVKKQPY